MGLIRAGMTAVGTSFADQWKEYFYADAMDASTLAVKGEKRVGKRSSNKKGNDNIISNGAVIAVNEGQCMMIVEQGKIVEVCAEAGEFIYDTSTEPSIFEGSLGAGIKGIFATIGKRFTFGGDAPKDQRIYYFNTKEIVDNKFGTREPVPFRVVDTSIGLDIDIAIRLNGIFSYRIANPLLFYTNVSGNVAEAYTRDALDSQLKAELLTHLGPALAKISAMGIRYSMLPGHSIAIRDALREELTEEWAEARGIEVVTVAINSATASDEDEELIKNLQKQAVYRSAGMGAAAMVEAQSEAMKSAAKNPNGAMMGFMGVGMAQAAGGLNANDLYARAEAERAAAPAAPAPAAGTWKCACGAENTGKFCSECGAKKPEVSAWTCACGTVNTGKFCSECGAKKPEALVCKRCGYRPEAGKTPKFCPECGEAF